MFGLSWGQIIIIVLVGVFVLGPERIPTAVTWVLGSLRKVRTMAAGAQAELRREIGPEIEELRRQVADLQSLKEIQELRDLRDLNPRRLIGKNILGDEFSGGLTGFLGLDQPAAGSPTASNGAANGAAPDSAGAVGGGAGGSVSTPVQERPVQEPPVQEPPLICPPPSTASVPVAPPAEAVVSLAKGSTPAAPTSPERASGPAPFDLDGT